MRLVINVHGLIPSQAGGLEIAFREVFRRILDWRLPGVEVVLLTSPSNHESFAEWADLAELRRLPGDVSPDALDKELAGADLLYCPLMFLQPRRPRIPSVVFIPDLQHEAYPEHFGTEQLAARTSGLRASACCAEAVITISEFSAERIRCSFRLPPKRVISVPLDAADDFRRPARPSRLRELRARLSLPAEWMLMPANNWPHKNHRRIFAALARYRERRGEPPTLLLTGARIDGGVDLEAAIEAAEVEELVRHLGWVDAEDMPYLYDGARCLLFSTLYEGFGIPLVEAMRRGTPILASRDSSTAEIAGEHATLVDPLSSSAIAEGLHQVLTTEPDRQAARARAGRFSYDQAARSTWKVFAEAAAGGRRRRTSLSAEAWPRFSVVTPSLNQARFLRSTIDSVLGQSYPHVSYFVADGGSTDGSREILESYGDRLEWTSRPDGGQAAAISRAWQRSDAEVVAYLNSDDTYLPQAIAKAAERLMRRPEASMVYGKTWIINEEGERLRPYPTRAFSLARLADECFISQPAAFLRREVFRVVEPLDVDLHYCMDYDLWIRVSKLFELSYLEEFLACSREHPNTKSLRDRQEVYSEILQVTQKHYGVPSRCWSVGAILNLCHEQVALETRELAPELQLRNRARLAQRLEADIIGPPYPDRWAGTKTLVPVVPAPDGRVSLVCESPFWPHDEPLRVLVEHGGKPIGSTTVVRRGKFELGFRVPPRHGNGNGAAPVLLRASRTFVPMLHGYSDSDDRPLSFLVR